MSMQKKPQLVEAVMFFGDGIIQKAMFFAEFEAVLDGVVDMPEFADQQVRAAYVLINPRLLIRSAVFFYLDFDERGKADTGWNMPLRHLAEKAGRGPDLGAGPIRLACRSQCPVSWHQMHMWDPDLAPGHNELSLLRDAVKVNRLGMLVEEESPPVELERLQMAHEEKWHAPPDPEQEQARLQAEQEDQEQRLKTAQLIKQLRLRITSLTQQNDDEVAQLKLAAEQQSSELNARIQSLQHALQQQEELNLNLKADLSGHAANLSNVREEMTSQLKAAERHAQSATELLRGQFDKELQAKISAAVMDYKEQIAIREVELAYHKEREIHLQQDLERLQAEHEKLAGQGTDQILQRLAALGVVFVVYHPGAGHLTIPLQDIARYQDNPMAYVAAKCFVSEEQYSGWLEHYQQPGCVALLPSGERCGMPVDRVDTPSRFVPGESNCCARHRASKRA
ncbi:chromosome partitioning protein ParA [Pseudomonas sp. N040]|uniref:chromosome partitioning protein ParA n=1 Tax=Pseudomonas sp. N040 TaxID=2785325 RepID=UPI0018A2EE66|nr:chromosome partitioning protein ParA [Pseudomonas sp. N040]MBF7729289.1 chromosome partitioning protein ParA [Pseudomonas sp. N040]MBW7012929.1 chromosome partitioning protein ParA [Pseudomonas sp. N040]